MALSKSHYHGDLLSSKRVYPPKGAAVAEPKVVQLFLLMFYPPKGDVQLILFPFIGVSKSLEPFKNR